MYLRSELTEYNIFISRATTTARKRKRWVNPERTEKWWVNLSSGLLLEQEWCKNLRMDYPTFMKLVDAIREQIDASPSSFRNDTIQADKRIAMVLYYLKDQGSYRMMTNTFDVSLSVCRAINSKLGPELITFPSTKEEIQDVVVRYENNWIPSSHLLC